MKAKNLPLDLLRSFEIVARRRNFTAAAKELGVTQAATSYQIKTLEQRIGFKLLERNLRDVTLTKEGRTLYPVVSQTLSELETTIEHLRAGRPQSGLAIELEPSFSANWLGPRLAGFWQQHPLVELELYHRRAPNTFGTDVDLAIRWGDGGWSNCVAERLLELSFTPMWSPKKLPQAKKLRRPADLATATLIHDIDRDGWRDWLTAAGVDTTIAQSGHLIDDTNVVVRAAIDGLGVALGPVELTRRHIDRGELVAGFSLRIPTRNAYYLLWRKSTKTSPQATAFITWLKAELKRGA
ncbi:MAG: LysR substrate-binding domain-containing protein [Dongiaceae bacterium]